MSTNRRSRKRIEIPQVKVKNVRLNTYRVSAIREENHSYLLDESEMPAWKKWLNFTLGLVLVFPCIACTLSIFSQLQGGTFFGLISDNPFSFSFLMGAGLCVAVHSFKIGRKLLLPVYVLGHEITHALFVFLCYGKVSAFNANPEGGYIIANRSNILVSLSPYIVPFWMLIVGSIFFTLGFFIDITSLLYYLYILLGATWSFNLLWALLMIPLGQSDLKDHGTFFSLTVIYFFNSIILSLFLELAGLQPNIAQWCFKIVNAHIVLFELLTKP